MYTWLRKLFNWITRIIRWLLLDAKYGILVLFTFPFIIFLCWLFFSEWEAVIRISSMLFQFLGLSTVAVGLVGTKDLFGSESLVSKVRLWAGRFPKYQEESKPSIIGNMNATLDGLSGIGHITTSKNRGQTTIK